MARQPVEHSAPQPQAEPRPSAAPAIAIRSVADIVRLAEEHRDIQFKVQVRQHLRPVSFGENRIEAALGPGAPKTLYNDLSRRLEMWTGARWLIVPSNAEGDDTLAETEARSKRAAETEATQDPVVAAVLKRFPGARIIGITMRGDAADSRAAPPPDDDAAEAEDVDDNNGQDD
jgi:DNA polymerase-3 subunit gamma/tau